ncbi:hypothetical protein ABIE50_002876 [Chitinophaga sp. OAE865]
MGKDAIYTRFLKEWFQITNHLHIVNIRIYVLAAFGGFCLTQDYDDFNDFSEFFF